MDVRFADLSDAEQCNQFYCRVYQKNRTMEQWRWEFLPRTFAGSVLPYVVAEDAGRIVGTQALIPIRMIDRSGVFWTAKSEETLVDPDYRGQRLFERMYDLLFRFADEHVINCIWGFTPAVKAFERLAFELPATTSQVFLPFVGESVPALLGAHGGPNRTPSGSLLRAGLRLGGALAAVWSGARVRMAATPEPCLTLAGTEYRFARLIDAPEGAGAVCETFIRRYGGVTIYRDQSYLQWRLFDNPYIRPLVTGVFANDRLVGWIACSSGSDRMGYIVDIMVAPEDDSASTAGALAAALLRIAVRDLRRTGVLGIRGWRVNDHPFDRLVRRAARSVGFYHFARGHTVVLYTPPQAPRRDSCRAFNSWYVTRAYTEGVMG